MVLQNPSSDQTNKHFFGFSKRTHVPPFDLSDDYEQRFPEDPLGEETGLNARVWRTYLAESTEFDAMMVGEARDGLDAMLVFAGLFSAVVTSFLVQTSQDLQADFTEMTAFLISELIAVQRAAANGTPVNTVSASPLNPNSIFIPTTSVVWVNGLWVVSLALALVVALAAVLVKQWLHRYMALYSAPPLERSHIRHFRYVGIEKWQVHAIIGSLPVIMHLSLALFLLGLVIFLVPLQPVLSCIIGGITFVVYVLYVVSHLLPIFYPQCPYQTPLSEFILTLSAKLTSRIPQLLEKLASYRHNYDEESLSSISDERPIFTEDTWSLKDLEKSAVDQNRHNISVEALHWLYNVSSNASVRSVILQAIGGLPVTVGQKLQTMFNYSDIRPVHEHLLRSCTVDGKNQQTRLVIGQLHRVAERLCRLFIFFPSHGIPWSIAFPSSKDGRFEATSLAQGLGECSTAETYRTFLSTHVDLLHHPLVWVRLVQQAYKIGTFSAFEDSHKISAAFCRALLPAVWGSLPSSYTTSSEMMPLHVAIRFHMPKDICLYLLGMLSRFDHLDFSLNIRVVAAAMEFALHHISTQPIKVTGAHWDIIHYVFSQSNDQSGYELHPTEHNQFIRFMTDFVVRLIKSTGICDHPLRSETLIERRASVLKVYWITTMKKVYAKSSESLEETEFVLLRRATQGTLRELWLLVDRTDYTEDLISESFASNANQVFDILSLALSLGCIEAYQIVEDLDCLELFAKFRQPMRTSAMVSSYVIGLKTLSPSARERYITHLYEPRNLHIAILALFEWWPYTQSHDIGVADLIQLRSDDLSWDECRRWLKYVSEWSKEDKRLCLPTFNARKLGEEWQWRVLRAYMTDLEDLGVGPVPPDANWSGTLKLREAIQFLDEFFASRQAENADADSLVIPPSPTSSPVYLDTR